MMATSLRTLDEAQSAARSVRSALPDELQPSVLRASELASRLRGQLRERPLTTSVAGLDRLLGGGLPRGCLVELVGRGSCGRFATLLTTLKMMTDSGEAVALVDQGEQLDPQLAVAVGLDLERLLWLRPRALPEALAAAELLVSTGFGLVAVDLGLPPVRGRAPVAAWLRLARGSVAHCAVVLVGSPYRLSGCAATAVVTAEGDRGRWSGEPGAPRLLHGLRARLELIRRRGHRPHESARTAFTLVEAAFARTSDELPTMEEADVQAL
jgi:hypothetical protein